MSPLWWNIQFFVVAEIRPYLSLSLVRSRVLRDLHVRHQDSESEGQRLAQKVDEQAAELVRVSQELKNTVSTLEEERSRCSSLEQECDTLRQTLATERANRASEVERHLKVCTCPKERKRMSS